MLSDKLQLSREKLEFIYSMAVLVLIPVLIAANTLLIIQGLRKTTDKELQRKANMVNEILGISVAQHIEDPAKIQEIIATVSKVRDDIPAISVAKRAGSSEDFEILAAKDGTNVGVRGQDTMFAIVANENQSRALEIRSPGGGRLWRVVSPLNNDEGQTVGVMSLDVSSQSADELTTDLLLRSFGIMVATIIVIVLLLFNHFRFVEYALLFKKMKEVDQLKNDFLSVATHELKSPMVVIKGSIENMMDGFGGSVDDKAKGNLQLMYQETERLNNLVGDLLNVSRLEQGRVSYALQPLDIRTIVTQVKSRYEAKAHEKGLELVYDTSDQPLIVNVDEGRLTEIMTNLIDNAIKYSRQGSVHILHKIEGDKIQTMVRDTGIGMSAKDREKLFTRFYRIQNKETHDIGGTGLGLWIIKQYIEHMDGHIYVDSMEGVGTEFIVEFSRSSATPAAAPENEAK